MTNSGAHVNIDHTPLQCLAPSFKRSNFPFEEFSNSEADFRNYQY